MFRSNAEVTVSKLMTDSAKSGTMPAMSPAAIRQQLQKRLHALEETKTLYSERAKMFLGDRAPKSDPVEEDKAAAGKGTSTSSAQAIRQQIFHRLQQLEENKAKYTERAKQFLDRERKEASKEPHVSPPTSPVQSTQEDMNYSERIKSQLDARVSQPTQDTIRAGVVRTRLDAQVSQETQEEIRGGLRSAQHHPNPVSPYAAPYLSPGSSAHSPSLAVSRALAGDSSPEQNQPSPQLNETFDRVAQWAHGTPLKSPGSPAQAVLSQRHPEMTTIPSFEEADTNHDGVISREEFAAVMEKHSSPASQPNVLTETVVQSLHDSVASLASDVFSEPEPDTPDCDGALSRLFDRIAIPAAAWTELRLLCSDRSHLGMSCDAQEFQGLVYSILDTCFDEFAARVGQGVPLVKDCAADCVADLLQES